MTPLLLLLLHTAISAFELITPLEKRYTQDLHPHISTDKYCTTKKDTMIKYSQEVKLYKEVQSLIIELNGPKQEVRDKKIQSLLVEVTSFNEKVAYIKLHVLLASSNDFLLKSYKPSDEFMYVGERLVIKTYRHVTGDFYTQAFNKALNTVIEINNSHMEKMSGQIGYIHKGTSKYRRIITGSSSFYFHRCLLPNQLEIDKTYSAVGLKLITESYYAMYSIEEMIVRTDKFIDYYKMIDPHMMHILDSTGRNRYSIQFKVNLISVNVSLGFMRQNSSMDYYINLRFDQYMMEFITKVMLIIRIHYIRCEKKSKYGECVFILEYPCNNLCIDASIISADNYETHNYYSDKKYIDRFLKIPTIKV